MIVLDISGSMGFGFGYGDNQTKLEVAKQSILALLEQLKERDSFSLILFDTVTHLAFNTYLQQAEVTQALVPVKELNLSELKEKILQMTPRGGTDLEKGIQAAAEQYKNIKESKNMNRVIFLTGNEEIYSNEKTCVQMQAQRMEKRF